jgi:hypothetical protein
MGVVVGTAFLAGVLGKLALMMRQRQKAAAENERNASGAKEKTVPDHNQSAKD